MTQCVPSWDLDENPAPQPRVALKAHSNSNSLASHVPMLDYEVAELTWENGQLSMHGLAPPRMDAKRQSTWDKPQAGGTLESIVNQGTTLPHCEPSEDFVPWFGNHSHAARVPTASANVSMDAMVPSLLRDQASTQMLEQVQTCVVGSCSGNNTFDKRDDMAPKRARVAQKRARVAHVPVVPSQRELSSSFSSHQLTFDTCDRELGVCGFTSTSMGSPENTSSSQQGTKTTTTDEHDSVYHTRHQRETGHEESKKKQGGKSSLSIKRSRTAAIHNQSERKRRDKINERMKTLQKLVPNSSKTDKASMLDEVIEYLKQLQAQVSMMNRMNMSPMMLPLTLQQQLQLSMMAQMGMGGMGLGMGMGLGGVMDLNSIGRPNLAGISPLLHPAAFMPLSSWPDRSGDQINSPAAMIADPMSAFLACQSQPMTMDAYSRMAALYQQFNQVPRPPASKK